MAQSFHITLDALRRLVRALHLTSRQSERHLGLSSAQIFALQKLQDGEIRSLNELATLTYTHQSSLSVVVRKLVAKGLIHSNPAPDDSRRLMLSISREGRLILDQAATSIQDSILAALAKMAPEKSAQLATLLSELIAQAGMSDTKTELFFEYEEAQNKEDIP